MKIHTALNCCIKNCKVTDAYDRAQHNPPTPNGDLSQDFKLMKAADA